MAVQRRARPDGTERLYADGRFHTDPDYCETYGHDLVTGAPLAADRVPRHEPGRPGLPQGRRRTSRRTRRPTDEYPLLLTTGRTVYHFHTRTKTARAPQLQAAAPDVWVELAGAGRRPRSASREGDLVRSRVAARTPVEARVRIGGIRPGMVFVPFHYGYWDPTPRDPRPTARAANEVTATDWDPVSKQPIFKVAAASLRSAATSANG